jgi:peptidoglycan/xylan/chitin deacetylase (PgdA/CDA1 family)
VPATFFDVGMRVAANPQFAGSEAREGHLVLDHTWSHPRLTDVSAAQIRTQVLRTQRVFAAAGAPLPFKLLRPPYGAVDDSVAATLSGLGYRSVLWAVLAVDWDVATTSEQISAGDQPGAVPAAQRVQPGATAAAAVRDRATVTHTAYCVARVTPGPVTPGRAGPPGRGSATALPRGCRRRG